MTIGAQFRTIPGTQAAEATIGGHTVIVDRPLGVAGGQGLGLNGGQLLALAIGGCLSNDLRYVAADTGVELGGLEVDVELEIEDARITSGSVSIRVTSSGDLNAAALVGRAAEVSTVLAAVRDGFPVDVAVNP